MSRALVEELDFMERVQIMIIKVVEGNYRN